MYETNLPNHLENLLVGPAHSNNRLGLGSKNCDRLYRDKDSSDFNHQS